MTVRTSPAAASMTAAAALRVAGHRNASAWAWAWAWALLTASGIATAQPLVLHYADSAPLQYADARGALTGLAAAPAMAALTAAGIAFEVRQTPVKQQLVLLKEDRQPACLLGWLQTPGRERIGTFSDVVYLDKRPFALTWAGNPAMRDEQPLKQTLADTRLRAALQPGVAHGAVIDRGLLRYATVAASSAADTQQLLELLRRHSIDYFFITDQQARGAIGAIGAGGQPASPYQRIYFSDLYKDYERRLWCSKSVPEALLQRLNQAIVRLRR